MNKILSVIVPTYNMESLLPRCLNSLLVDETIEDIEVLVVNDGSKDGSLAVALDYECRYKKSVRVIDKPNGNYGSTINAALPIATGKYVKILDSDDWFDTSVLICFIDELKRCDVDLVVTPFTQLWPGGKKEVVRYNTMGKEVYEHGRVYDADTIFGDGFIRFFLMHAISYRTDLLREIGYRQTEGISYTDTQWASYPIFYIENIVFLNLKLYQYNIDREGQTMDPAVVMKSIGQLGKVTDEMLNFYRNFDFSKVSDNRKRFLKQYFENRLRIMYKLYLLDMPRDDFDKESLMLMDEKYSKLCNEFGFRIRLFPENKLLRIDYIKYWHIHQSRWPKWLEKTNHLIDVVIKWLYVKVFRR